MDVAGLRKNVGLTKDESGCEASTTGSLPKDFLLCNRYRDHITVLLAHIVLTACFLIWQ